MEFGFSHHVTENYREHVHLAQFGEELGFDFFWLPDQTFFPDPYVLLGMAGQITQRIQIGLAVTNPHTRHPAISARSIGTLAQIAPSRVHVAFGAGNNKELLSPLGLDGAHSGSKIREMTEIVRGLLSGETIDYHGHFYQAAGVRLDFVPPGKTSIYIAGRGSFILRTAGEVADGVIIGAICNQKGIKYAIDQVRLGAASVNRKLSDIRIVSWLTVVLTENRDHAIQSVKRQVAHIIGGAPDEILENVGLDIDLTCRIKDVYRSEGIPQAAEYVTDDCVDAFAIVGDAKELVKRVEILKEAGVDQLSINFGDDQVKNLKLRIKAIAEAVFPHFPVRGQRKGAH